MSYGKVVLYSIGAGLLAVVITALFMLVSVDTGGLQPIDLLKQGGLIFLITTCVVASELLLTAYQRNRKDRG